MSRKIQQARFTVRSVGEHTEDNRGNSSMVVFEAVEFVDAEGVVARLEGVLAFGKVAQAIFHGGELDLVYATGITAGKANHWGSSDLSYVYLAKEPDASVWVGERDIEELKRIRGDVFKQELIAYPMALVAIVTVFLSPLGLKLLWDVYKARRMANATPSRDQVEDAVSAAKRSLVNAKPAFASPAKALAPKSTELSHDLLA